MQGAVAKGMGRDTVVTELYPWQTAIWKELAGLQQQERLPHALLIAGVAGLGKRDLAKLLAKRLLCESPDTARQPCLSCRSCRLFSAGHHPDFHRVLPQGKRNAILVDQIRDLIEFVSLTSQHNGRKIACVLDADRMNANAANSFLKTLEEPPNNTLLLLTSDAPQRLPATIRSRCRLVRVSKPKRQLGLDWLADQGIEEAGELLLDLANNAPLRARALADETALARRRALFEQFLSLLRGVRGPLDLAADWQNQDCGEVLGHLHGWTQDMLRLNLTGTCAVILNRDLGNELEAIAKRLPTQSIFALLSRTQGMLETCESSVSAQLTFEDLLIDWTRVARAESDNQGQLRCR